LRRAITAGRWSVPQNLSGSDDWANGVVVMGGFTGKALIADCRGMASRDEQLANAKAIACLPELIEALAACEQYLGDLPAADREARRLHQSLVTLMSRGLR
jgi:hypothetical protein